MTAAISNTVAADNYSIYAMPGSGNEPTKKVKQILNYPPFKMLKYEKVSKNMEVDRYSLSSEGGC